MTNEDLFELLDRTSKVASTLTDNDSGGYAELTGLVAQLAMCIDDGTISEGQPGIETTKYLICTLIDSFHLEW